MAEFIPERSHNDGTSLVATRRLKYLWVDVDISALVIDCIQARLPLLMAAIVGWLSNHPAKRTGKLAFDYAKAYSVAPAGQPSWPNLDLNWIFPATPLGALSVNPV